MTHRPNDHVEPEQRMPEAMGKSIGGQQAWEEPKLTFIEPKLTKHGRLEEVTAGFFGGFSP